MVIGEWKLRLENPCSSVSIRGEKFVFVRVIRVFGAV